jgi:hypothetical protein
MTDFNEMNFHLKMVQCGTKHAVEDKLINCGDFQMVIDAINLTA